MNEFNIKLVRMCCKKFIMLFVFLQAILLACNNSYVKNKVGSNQNQNQRDLADELRKTLMTLNLNNPEDDLNKNLQKGDTSFIGLYGYTLYYPGVPDSEL